MGFSIAHHSFQTRQGVPLREQWQSFRWAWQECGMQEFRHPRGSRPLYQHVEDFAADQTIPPLDGGAPQISPGTAQTVCSGEWFSLCAMACELCTARWHGSNRLYGRMVFIVCYGLRIVHCPLARLKPFVWEKVFHCVLRPFVRPFVRPCNRRSDRPYVCPSIPPSVRPFVRPFLRPFV